MSHSSQPRENRTIFPSFLASELGETNPADALFHVIPVPYEKTVSYGKGTGLGPEAILWASQQLELYDGCGVPAERGIHTRPALDCEGPPESVLSDLGRLVGELHGQGRIPVVLGGEHTVTAGAVCGFASLSERVGVVQFDAHADLRDQYEGTIHSHACAMRRVLDNGFSLFQIGVRSLSFEEEVFRKDLGIGRLDAVDIFRKGIPECLLPEDFPRNIYLTIDVDVFDPSLMPSTGTPEPGGLLWYQMIQVLEQVIARRNVVGFDVVELAPIAGFHAPDFTAARLIYNLMGLIIRNRENDG